MTKEVPMKKKKVLAYDLGGTKVHIGVVDETGKILVEERVPVLVEKGKVAVLNQLGELGRKYIQLYPEIKYVGLASAGPMDPTKGLLLDPTNLSNPNDPNNSWGRLPITKILGAKLKRKVILENDAAAAMLAEHWKGKAKNCSDAMIMTLGTGLGTGIIANGELVRAGRMLHPEAGHLIIRMGDQSAPCGCGNLGCAEAFLSGRSFTRRNRPRFARADYMAKDITELAEKGDPRALAAFEEYAELMATTISCYVVLYSPKIVVFAGSFSEAAHLFIPRTLEHLKVLLKRRRVGVDLMPKLAVSALNNKAGLLGGAFVALQAAKKK